MDERRLGSLMLGFEREQAWLRKRPPLPCDGKLKVQKYKRPDWTQELLCLIEDNPGITTNALFDLVYFAHADFTASLRTLLKRGRVLVGQKGRARIYYPMVKGR